MAIEPGARKLPLCLSREQHSGKLITEPFHAAKGSESAHPGTTTVGPEKRAMEQQLDILYEDNHCLAIVKPAGHLSTHYDGREETLDREVKEYLKEKYRKPGNVFLGIVHRLDRLVSGV